MAEGWAKELLSDSFNVYSAGTEYYKEVKPLAVHVMEEVGIKMSMHQPKLLSDIPKEVDFLITMGCNVKCPYVPNRHKEDWGLDDPSGGTLDDFRKTRDLIKKKVIDFKNRIEEGDLTLSLFGPTKKIDKL